MALEHEAPLLIFELACMRAHCLRYYLLFTLLLSSSTRVHSSKTKTSLSVSLSPCKYVPRLLLVMLPPSIQLTGSGIGSLQVDIQSMRECIS